MKTPPLPVPIELMHVGDKADVIQLPARSVVAIDGVGEPGGDAFQSALQALYAVAYTMKYARKGTARKDFRIGPLEARWWTDDPARMLMEVPREAWHWRLRIAVPADAERSEVEAAAAAAGAKKTSKAAGNPDLPRVFLERIKAQRVGRKLHVGPYSTEQRSFDAILGAIAAAHRAPGHAHSELYFSDPRRTAPERLRTGLFLDVARPMQ